MIIAGQNFRTSRDVNVPQQVSVNIIPNSIYNKTKVEGIAINTTKTYAIGTFHSIDILVKGNVATITVNTDPTTTLYDGQKLTLSYNDLNNVPVTIVTDNNTTVLCTIKTL